MAIVTPSQISAYLGALTPAQNSLVPGILAGVCNSFQQATGWLHFEPTVDTLEITPDNSLNYVLDCALLSLTSISVDGVALTSDQYILYPRNYTRKRFVTFLVAPQGQTISIAGTWGYGETPADVVIAFADAVGAVLAGRTAMVNGMSAGGVLSKVKQGPVELTYQTGDSVVSTADLMSIPAYANAVKAYRFRSL